MSIDHFDPPLTVPEAAAALSIKRGTLYKLLKARQLTAVKILGSTRIRSSEIMRFHDSLTEAKFAPLTDKEGARTA